MDFRETIREFWQGCIYLYERIRGRQSRFDHNARRAADLESAFGVRRSTTLQPKSMTEKSAEDPRERRQRQRPSAGDNMDFRLVPVTREKSEGFELQIERELERRGYGSS